MAKELLREFVQSVLAEAPITLASAAAAGLGLFTYDGENEGFFIVLYDVGRARERVIALKNSLDEDTDVYGELEKALLGVTLGYARLLRPRDPCNGASEIANSAAVKGYGPLIYDIAMKFADNHTITADRKNVSLHARRIWDQMKSRGSSVHTRVDVMYHDDVDDPKTPPPEDDCRVHPGGKTNSLNYAFRATNPVDTSRLEANSEKFIAWTIETLKGTGIEETSVMSILLGDGANLFNTKYWNTLQDGTA